MEKNQKIYYPMLAPEPEGFQAPQIDRWTLFDASSERAQTLLTDNNTIELIKAIVQDKNLDEQRTLCFVALIRLFLLNQIDQATFTAKSAAALAATTDDIELFLEQLFSTRSPANPVIDAQYDLDVEKATATEIAAWVTPNELADERIKNKLLKRLQSPRFANALLCAIATDYYPKLKFVHNLYTQANEQRQQ